VRLYIVRHACAGHKHAWDRPDHVRPLDGTGETQAEALTGMFTDVPLARLASSPSRRCEQTLEPLAAVTGLPIELLDVLATTSDPRAVRALFGDPSFADSVLCTHGEVLRPLLQGLRDEGVQITADRLDEEWLTAKGSAWFLDVGPDGTVERFEHHSPMGIQTCPEHP
jgi:phosphohistidine phosphatase SixA